MLDNIIKIDDTYSIKKMNILGNEILTLCSNNACQSACFCSENRMFDIVDDYVYLYDILPSFDKVNSVLVLGGGGFTYPKYYIAKYPNKTMDVVEINQDIINISYKYFYLDKLYEQYDRNKERLKIICDDAYNYIKTTNIIYDGILIDLFIDEEPLDIMHTDDFIYNIKRLINEKYLMINYIILKDKKEKYLKFKELLSKYFKNIKVITFEEKDENEDRNVIICCSDNKIDIPNRFIYHEVL